MDQAEEDGPRVTLKLVYNAVTNVQRDVTELKQSVVLNAFAAEQDRGKISDHEQRIRLIERWLYAIPATVITAIVAAVVAILK